MKDDRGQLDLTKQIDDLKQTIEGYKLLLQMQKKELWKLRMATSDYSGTQSGGTVTTSGSDTIITYNSTGSYTSA